MPCGIPALPTRDWTHAFVGKHRFLTTELQNSLLDIDFKMEFEREYILIIQILLDIL